MLKKKYFNIYAKVGDTVVTTSNPFNNGDWVTGYEYEVIELGHGYIVATSDRLPSYKKEITIGDAYYQVVKMVEVPDPPKVKEKQVKVYKFLGIPLGRRITYTYETK
ncbi:hypothetical protein [Lysinibacillus sp. NPDC086135]|uniref:hypothetical protein n=1 Tax=Lysinibacillus sp. NPDC086135 TaxID=3364130 RepID=UPI0037FF4731